MDTKRDEAGLGRQTASAALEWRLRVGDSPRVGAHEVPLCA